MVPKFRFLAGRPPGLLRGPAFSNTAGALFALDVLLSAPAWTLAALRVEPGPHVSGQAGYLVGHQSHDRRDDDYHAGQHQSGQLKAERFARTGRHDGQSVLALAQHGAEHRRLTGPEGAVAEVLVQHGGQGLRRHFMSIDLGVGKQVRSQYRGRDRLATPRRARVGPLDPGVTPDPRLCEVGAHPLSQLAECGAASRLRLLTLYLL